MNCSPILALRDLRPIITFVRVPTLESGHENVAETCAPSPDTNLCLANLRLGNLLDIRMVGAIAHAKRGISYGFPFFPLTFLKHWPVCGWGMFPLKPSTGKPSRPNSTWHSSRSKTRQVQPESINKLKTTPTPNKNGSYGIEGGGFVCHKSRSSYSMTVGSCTTFSVRVPLFQGFFTPYDPSFYGIFWEHSFC